MAINAKRLLKLADYLETVPREKFDMGLWGNPSCGTAGCAIGWAMHANLFKGFVRKPGSTYPIFQECEGFEAIERLFNINDRAAWDLFGRDHVRTPKQVASRIRKFVRDNTKEKANV